MIQMIESFSFWINYLFKDGSGENTKGRVDSQKFTIMYVHIIGGGGSATIYNKNTQEFECTEQLDSYT